RVINHTERTRKEMTTCLLRNIELEKEKDELEEVLRLSEDEHKEDGIQQEIPLETGKQQEEGTDSEEELQMLIDRVCSIANDLKDSLTFATGQVEQAIVDKTLSERTEKQLHLTIDSLRDSIPLTEQLLSLVNPENGYTEVPGSTLLDVFTNKPVSKYKTGSRVLIVEDTQDIKELLVANLEGYGYSVVASTSFMNAKDIISKSINDIGCIIIDVVLNDGSGIDLIRAAHESKPLLPILAGSAYPLSSSDLEYLKKDGISLISKPYKIDTLLLKLSTILPL
ncbi:MAG: response regulator, partial [Candidatus Fermentibacteria bacterium]